MRRLVLTLGAAGLLIAFWWLAEDGELRQRLTEIGQGILDGDPSGPQPNWSDVAEKVGAFTEEERNLRNTIGGGAAPTAAPTAD